MHKSEMTCYPRSGVLNINKFVKCQGMTSMHTILSEWIFSFLFNFTHQLVLDSRLRGNDRIGAVLPE